MYSAGSQQSMQSSNAAGASSSSTTAGSNVARPNPSPPMTPGRQQASPSPVVHQQQQQPSAPAAAVRGRHRELQQLNNEMQLLQEELHSLDNIPPASKACKDLVTFVESRADPFIPNSDGVAPPAWPYDRPVKASRWCWKF